MDVEFNFTSNEYPHGILLMDPSTPKTRNTWKNVMMTSSSHFFRYFLFLGLRCPSKVCCVGTRWMWNLIPHPTIPLVLNLSKNTGRYVENTNKKSSFFNDKYGKSAIMVESFYWNSIGSWIPTHKNLLLDRFLIRPILDPKFPLIVYIFICFSFCYNLDDMTM